MAKKKKSVKKGLIIGICWLSTTEKTGSLISADQILIIIMNPMAASRR